MPNFITNMSKFEKIFWVAILVLLFTSILLVLLQQSPPERPVSTPTPDSKIEKEPILAKYFPKDILEENHPKITKNLAQQKQIMLGRINIEADDLFNTNNVDNFLDFHYSVTGEYTELVTGTLGEIQKMVTKKLFGNFEENQKYALLRIQEQFKTGVNEHGKFIADIALEDVDIELNNEALTRLNNDIEFNKTIQLTKAPVVVSAIVISKIISKMIVVFAGKTLVKITAKGGMAAAAASVGVLCGPFVAVCATTLAVVTWFTVDYIVIKLDEYWYRDEFRAEIIDLFNYKKQSFVKQYSDFYNDYYDKFSGKTISTIGKTPLERMRE